MRQWASGRQGVKEPCRSSRTTRSGIPYCWPWAVALFLLHQEHPEKQNVLGETSATPGLQWTTVSKSTGAVPHSSFLLLLCLASSSN